MTNQTGKETETLDVRGLQCPLPVLKARKKLQEIEEGNSLKVLATDPASTVDMPFFCQSEGHRLTATVHQEDWIEFTIERGNSDQTD